jgi:hypothetical protein
MTNSSKPRKRVVSKGQYISYLAKKAGLSSVSGLLFCSGLMGLLLAGCGLLASVLMLFGSASPGSDLPISLIWASLSIGVASLLVERIGFEGIKEAQKMTPVLPLTRHNVEQLPEPESLVRASSEPAAEQCDVLLRAAHPGQETPAEQLLRPLE